MEVFLYLFIFPSLLGPNTSITSSLNLLFLLTLKKYRMFNCLWIYEYYYVLWVLCFHPTSEDHQLCQAFLTYLAWLAWLQCDWHDFSVMSCRAQHLTDRSCVSVTYNMPGNWQANVHILVPKRMIKKKQRPRSFAKSTQCAAVKQAPVVATVRYSSQQKLLNKAHRIGHIRPVLGLKVCRDVQNTKDAL